MPFSLIPDVILPSLPDVTPELLRSRGISWLLLDFDNTVVPYTRDEPSPRMKQWLSDAKQAELRLCIVSNTKRERVLAFGERYGIPVVTHAKKPFSRGIREAAARFGFQPQETALVGDQIYTDTLGANCAGLTSILVSAIHNHTVWLKLRHLAELPFIAIGKRRMKREEC